MDARLFKSGAVENPPDPPDSPSIGYPISGDSSTGLAATVPGPYRDYMIGQSLQNIIVAAGLTPDHTDLTLLLEAIKKVAGNRKVTVLTASDPVWAPQSSTKVIEFVAVGGGGGGGGVDGQGTSTGADSGSGGGGGYAYKATNVIDSSYNITIGAGGAGGAAGNNNGSSGGNTSVVSTSASITANGGGGGGGSLGSSANTAAASGSGGTATGGDINLKGRDGSRGRTVNGIGVGTGTSGASTMGGGKTPTPSANGLDADVYGEGGGSSVAGAADTNFAGGNGFQGVVIITEYS